MEKFLKLPLEKRNIIVDAALKCFGNSGYKKTSIADIAAEAGISKATVFHYFGTKKAMYFYLIDLCSNIIMTEINEKFDDTITDFFDRIMLAGEIKFAAMHRHPAILLYLTSVYFESDEEVKDDIKAVIAKSEGFRNKIALEGIDYSKFKDDVDVKLVMKMLYWLAEGYTNQLYKTQDIIEVDYNVLYKEYFDCMKLLRNNFYKVEYL